MLIYSFQWYEQQHGTVYWGKGSRDRLQRLDPIKFLHEQFATSFSVTHSPVWMDSSTSKECSVLEEIVGGPHVSIDLTHSIVCNKDGLHNACENIHPNIWRYIYVRIYMNAYVYWLTLAFTRVYFRDVKHPKRLTVVTTRERIGQIFKVAALHSAYTHESRIDNIYSQRRVISEISGNNGFTGVREILGTADSENSAHEAGSLLQH